MISANFGPGKGNPRERRAYVHAMLDKARFTGGPNDYLTARQAVEGILWGHEMPKKTRGSRFDHALAGVAMRDPEVSAVVRVGNDLLRYGEITGTATVGTADSPSTLVFTSAKSPDFDLIAGRGAVMNYQYLKDYDGRKRMPELTVTSHSGAFVHGDRISHNIPLGADPRTGAPRVSIDGLMQLKGQNPGELSYLARQADRIEGPKTKSSDPQAPQG